MATAEDFRRELMAFLDEANRNNEGFVEISAKALHEKVGGYPSNNHRMPNCCQVMKSLMSAGDEIIYEPPSGQGATLTIKYSLPRVN